MQEPKKKNKEKNKKNERKKKMRTRRWTIEGPVNVKKLTLKLAM